MVQFTDYDNWSWIASRITKSYHLILENTLIDLKLKMAKVEIDLAVNLRAVKVYIFRAFIRRNFKSNARLSGVKYRS